MPERLRAVIGRASAPDPVARYPDIAAFVAAYAAAVASTVVVIGQGVTGAVSARDDTTARALRAVGLGLRPQDLTLLGLGPRITALGPAATPSSLDSDAADAEALLDINTYPCPPASAKPPPSTWMPPAIAMGMVALGLLVAVAFANGTA